MYIKEIELVNFRNYDSSVVNLSNGLNIIYGNNAAGKTNLLESIYVLGLTKSHRSFIDNSLIKSGCDFFKLKGSLIKNNIKYLLEVNNKKKKNLFLDGKEIRKISDYISNMNIIIFYPEDLDIIKGNPANRRNFLDLELSQLYSNYINILSEYNRLLKMRNERLKQNIDEFDNYIKVLTGYLIDRGILIYRMRKKIVNRLNEYCAKIYEDLTGCKGFYIKYNPNIVISDESDIKNSWLKLYEDNIFKELQLRKTLIGPHLDDIEFFLENNNLKYYGSQGQQRIAIIATKLSLIEVFKKYKNDTPILLLDDVFSELDIIKKNNLLKYIKNNIQTIITTTDLDNFDKSILESAKILKIDDGKIEEVENGKE